MDSIPNHKHSGPPKQPGPVSIQSNPLRWGFGAVLFLAWGIATIIWVASTVYSVAHGDVTSAVTAVTALALLVLLGGMEGLEVAVIDRWQEVWPGQSTSSLAGWLAARQLFVALIVTAAALLANRSVLVVPGTSIRITNGFTMDAFDLVWTTLTVLWFAQIFPKHLGATNPDRYLGHLRQSLFPIVGVVYRVGVSQPGEWTAGFVENRLAWSLSEEELIRRRPAHEQSLAAIWCELRKPHRRGAHPVGGSRPGGA